MCAEVKAVQIHVNLTEKQFIDDYHKVSQATGISSKAELVRYLLRQYANELDRQESWAAMLEAARARREGRISDADFDAVIERMS